MENENSESNKGKRIRKGRMCVEEKKATKTIIERERWFYRRERKPMKPWETNVIGERDKSKNNKRGNKRTVCI